MKQNKQLIGKKAHFDGHEAEKKAALYLENKGYQILKYNYKPPRGLGAGEIDLIAFKSKILIFVEVKYRTSHSIAAESVSLAVQKRRVKGAEYFLMKNPEYEGFDMRFDVILITSDSLIDHLENAFEVR